MASRLLLVPIGAALAGWLFVGALFGCRRDGGGTLATAQAVRSAGRTDARSAAPAIAFAESAYDFGVVNEGTPLRHVFEVRNRGTAPLLLSGVATSCGCTAATLGDTTIPPGGSGPLEVKMDTHGQHGKGTRTITVSSNDPRHPTATVTIAYDVERLLFLDRSFVELKTARGHPRVEQVWLSGDLAQQARLRVVAVAGGAPVTVRLLDKGRQGLQLELRADRASSGDGTVTVATGIPSAPELTLPFHYQVD
jgi:hypothetical protein